MHQHHRCTCQYIPPHVLTSLAKQRDADTRKSARTTAHQSKTRRTQRSTKAIDLQSILASATTLDSRAAATAGAAEIEIYDSDHTWAQRLGNPRTEASAESTEHDVETAFASMKAVRDFFLYELGRNSYDNQGSTMVLSVNFGQSYMNAFWDGDEMTFGDGDGQIFTSFAQSLDVIAHEFAHGVTQFTANLDYYSQSGALNEHFSDVFGTAITQHVHKQDPDDADWLVGNEIMGPTLFGESLRSMKAPGTAYDNGLIGPDPQPSHMDDYYTGNADNQGVHINSGIPNRAFYIVASELGDTTLAARIWYHGLQNLWPTADFQDAAEVLVESSRELTRTGIAPEGTTQIVRLAFRDVGITA